MTTLEEGGDPAEGTVSIEKVKTSIDASKEDSWGEDCSDDDSYCIQSSDIKELYEKISRRETMTLSWKLPIRRRSPTPPRGVVEVTKVVSDGHSTDVVDNTRYSYLCSTVPV